jgi:hypothetical protein
LRFAHDLSLAVTAGTWAKRGAGSGRFGFASRAKTYEPEESLRVHRMTLSSEQLCQQPIQCVKRLFNAAVSLAKSMR